MARTVALVLVAVILATAFTAAQSGQELYQQGLGKSQLGDYESAIKFFDRIVRESPDDRPLVARAKLQMVDCWMKLGDAKAQDLLNDLIKNYQDQAEVVTQAKRLAERTSRVSRLTDKDVLVLADFVNTTEDSVFGLALRQALLFQIEQSPFLRIMDAAQVRQALQFMGRGPDEPLTSAVARDLCLREQEKATLQGSIASIGKTYVIGLEAINCQTGATMAREQATAGDKEGVLQALTEAATGMRIKLGESLSSIQSPARSYTEGTRVTTSSLEAFQEFALADSEFAKGSYSNALVHYRRATELDPNFAMAFAVGAVTYRNVGDIAQFQQFADRAWALQDGVASEREKLFIAATHYQRTGEQGKQRETYELLTRRYPRDAAFHNNLGIIYDGMGEVEKAASEYQAVVREAPRWFLGHSNLALLYLRAGRIEDARTVTDKAIALGVDAPQLHQIRLRIAKIQNDTAAADEEIQWFTGKR